MFAVTNNVTYKDVTSGNVCINMLVRFSGGYIWESKTPYIIFDNNCKNFVTRTKVYNISDVVYLIDSKMWIYAINMSQ